MRSLESDDWTSLGAPVFVRGQLRSYARLVGLDIETELAQSAIPRVSSPELVSHSHAPRYQRLFEQTTRRAIYIVMTVTIAVPVWLATHQHLSKAPTVESLELPATPGDSTQAASRPRMPPRTALTASMAPMPTASTAALSFSFNGDSWLQVFAADGRSIEQGLLSAGEHRSYGAGQVGRVVLGNSAAVEVRREGKPVDLAPLSRANVARFTLSSDGSLAPVVD